MCKESYDTLSAVKKFVIHVQKSNFARRMLQQIGRYKEDFKTSNDENKFIFVENSVTVGKL